MTLVPIIYTSLVIFFALLLFIITVSYLSFKMKSKNRKDLYLERLAVPDSMIISKPVMMNTVKLQNNPSPVQVINLSKQISNRQPIVNDRKENRSYTQVTSRQDYVREKDEDLRRRHNERASLTATRLEIMNGSNKYRKILEYKEEPYDRHGKIVDANLFNYYDNSTTDSFLHMDTSLLHKIQ